MADNSLRTPGSGESVATDELTYSGDTAKVQIVRVVHVSGAEGSKALTEVFDATNGHIVGGNVAHDGVDAGSPVKVGMRAIAHGASPTAVAAADRTDWLANRHGVPWVIGGHPNVLTFRSQFTAAQTDAALVTASAGQKIVLTAFQVTLDNASTVFPSVRLGFGGTNTPTGAGVVGAHGGVPAGGGFSRGDGSGIIGIGADGEDLRITTVGVATGNGVEVVGSYYIVES